MALLCTLKNRPQKGEVVQGTGIFKCKVIDSIVLGIRYGRRTLTVGRYIDKVSKKSYILINSTDREKPPAAGERDDMNLAI